MTKDEFLSMLSSELESLENQLQAAKQRVEYFKALNSKGEQVQEAEYQLRILQQKVDALKRLITLPAYARIQVMSDPEIEEYRKGKVEELELRIKEIESREEQEKARFAQLKAEQERLITQFGTLYGSERDDAINKGRQLNDEIGRYDDVFAQLKSEIEEARKQQEQIKVMTSQEIKQHLLSEVKENNYLAQIINGASNPIDVFTELKASVASD